MQIQYYLDELAHAAAWLAYEAVLYGDAASMTQYLSEAAQYLSDGAPWALDWSDKRGLVNVSTKNLSSEHFFLQIDDVEK